MTLETLVLWIVIGGVAGIVADWLIPAVRLGLIESNVVGILGAFLRLGCWGRWEPASAQGSEAPSS